MKPFGATIDKSLRKRAEQRLRSLKPRAVAPSSPGGMQKLIEELHEYQAELELQHEDLLETQDRLEETEQRLSDLYHFAPLGYITLDSSGNISNANLTATRQFGKDQDQLIGSRFGLRVKPEHRTLFNEFLQTVRESSSTPYCTVVLDQASPLPVMVRIDGSFDGMREEYRLSILDVSERERLVQQLEEYQDHLEELVEERTADVKMARDEALAADRAKSAFLANMSHEIRTPMNAIVGFAYLLEHQLADPAQVALIEKITDAVEHLLSLVNDVLDLSKIEAGKLDLHMEDFDLDSIFHQVESLVKEQASGKGLKLEIGPVEAFRYLHGDPKRLKQALLNLLANAVKFTQHGVVTLEARVLKESNGQVKLQFDVSDTGVGIESEMISRLFKPFAQLDTSTTRKTGGTGLGLAITDRIARLMGGSTGVESERGKGSRFWFTAQFTRARSPQKIDTVEPKAKERDESLHARILLVEDNAINQAVARSLLELAGLSVEVAHNGIEAIKLWQQHDFDLVLMDVQMPKMDGLEATRIIRSTDQEQSSSEKANIPVLAMTANVYPEDRQACLDAGMNDFVSKPVNPEQMIATIRKHLAGKRRA